MTAILKAYNPEIQDEFDFWRRIGMPARGAKLHDALHQGLSFSVYGKLAELAGLEKKELAKYALIAPATLQRRAKAGRFNQQESDRLYRLAELLKASVDLFEGDIDASREWLNKPALGLGGRRPIDMLATTAETEAVLDLIGRLEQGVVV